MSSLITPKKVFQLQNNYVYILEKGIIANGKLFERSIKVNNYNTVPKLIYICHDNTNYYIIKNRS